jgi:hypothetical protein
MDRLEIAARIMAALLSRHKDPNDHWNSAKDLADETLILADTLIARERETRPKCEHPRANKFFVEPSTMRPVCPDCGQTVMGEPA